MLNKRREHLRPGGLQGCHAVRRNRDLARFLLDDGAGFLSRGETGTSFFVDLHYSVGVGFLLGGFVGGEGHGGVDQDLVVDWLVGELAHFREGDSVFFCTIVRGDNRGLNGDGCVL